MNKIILSVLALSVALSSCKLNDKIEQAPENTGVSFKHADTKINAGSDDQFVASDEIGVYMTATKSTSALTANAKYTYATEGNIFTAIEADVIKFPDANEYDFYAYYPFTGTSKTDTPVKISVKNQDGATNKGLFALRSVAVAQTKAAKSEIALSFKRLTSKIEFTFEPGTGIKDLTNLTLVTLKKFASEHTLAVIENTYSDIKNEDISSTITNGTVNTASALVYILPTAATNEAADADNLQFIFTLDGKDYPVVLKGITFDAGKIYKYKVTLSTTEITIIPTIAPWTSEDRGDIDAER